jgi:hypothetical protein
VSDRYSEELCAVIGNPTETLVAERVYMLGLRNGNRLLPGLVVANELVAQDEADDLAHAYRLIGDALDKKEICLLSGDDLLEDEAYPYKAAIALDNVHWMRMRRRKLFWELDEVGVLVPAHLPNETLVARAAIVHWLDEMEENPSTLDLLSTISEISGLEPELAPLHALLNSLDAGAVRSQPEWEEGEQWFEATCHRWYLTNWTQP